MRVVGMTRIIRKIISIGIQLLVLVACARAETQSQLLSRLGVAGPGDFQALSPCKQIEIYAVLGSKYTDVDHMTVLVPQWMDQALSEQPPEVVVDCIVNEVDNQLSRWGTSYDENVQISYSVHALLYKADQLDIMKHPKLEQLFKTVVCQHKVFYDGQLVIIYYTDKFGTTGNPSYDEMVRLLCS